MMETRGSSSMAAPFESCPQPDYLTSCWTNMPGPAVHQLLSLVEEVAPAICGLDPVLDRMRQRHLANLPRKASFLCRPVAERTSKPVCGHRLAHPTQRHQEGHVGKWLFG